MLSGLTFFRMSRTGQVMIWQASVKSCAVKASFLFASGSICWSRRRRTCFPAELRLAAKHFKAPVILNMSFALRWAEITSEACHSGFSRNVRKTAVSLLSLDWRPRSRCEHALEQYAM